VSDRPAPVPSDGHASMPGEGPPPDEGPPYEEAAAPAATYTREELDAAEPERPPSRRRRWLLGVGLGAVGLVLLSYEGFPILALLCLPFALTPTGAGVLVGSGLAWLVLIGWSLVVWLNGDIAGSPMIGAWVLAGAASLAAGLVATAFVARRGKVA
jgi:hypothetical protein